MRNFTPYTEGYRIVRKVFKVSFISGLEARNTLTGCRETRIVFLQYKPIIYLSDSINTEKSQIDISSPQYCLGELQVK